MYGSVDVTTFVALSTLFGMITEDCLLVKGGCPQWDVGRATGVGRADKWESGYKGVLSCRQENPKVAVLPLATGTLDQICVSG